MTPALILAVISILVTVAGITISAFVTSGQNNRKFGEMLAEIATLKNSVSRTDERMAEKSELVEHKSNCEKQFSKLDEKSVELERELRRSNERYSERLAAAAVQFREDLRTEFKEFILQLQKISDNVTELKVSVRELQVGKINRGSATHLPISREDR